MLDMNIDKLVSAILLTHSYHRKPFVYLTNACVNKALNYKKVLFLSYIMFYSTASGLSHNAASICQVIYSYMYYMRYYLANMPGHTANELGSSTIL